MLSYIGVSGESSRARHTTVGVAEGVRTTPGAILKPSLTIRNCQGT